MKANEYIYINPQQLLTLELTSYQLKVVCWICTKIDEDNTAIISVVDKNRFLVATGMKASTYHNNISQLIKKGVLTKLGNQWYAVNNKLIKHYKGKK